MGHNQSGMCFSIHTETINGSAPHFDDNYVQSSAREVFGHVESLKILNEYLK